MLDKGTIGSLKDIDALIARTQSDGVVPEGIAKEMLAAVKRDSLLMSDPQSGVWFAKMTQAWKVAEMELAITEAIEDADPEYQSHLIAALGSLDSESARKTITKLTKSPQPDLQFAAVKAMLNQRPQVAIAPVLAMLENEETRDRALTLLGDLIARKGMPATIAAQISKRSFSPDQSRAMLTKLQASGGNAELEASIRKAGKLADAAWKLTPELAEQLVANVKSDGDANRGEQIYRRSNLQCINCHAIGTAGGLVGPNLISIGGSAQVDYIIESLLDPSAKLKEGYTTSTILTDEGRVVTGIAIGESEESIKLRLADGKEVSIAKDAIEDQTPGKSLMPMGLVDSLTRTELVDLTAFLSAMGRRSDFTVSTKPLVRSWETLIYTSEANRRLNRTSTDVVASDDSALQWRTITSLVDGKLPIGELDRFQQHRTTPPMSFVRFQVELAGVGAMSLKLPDDFIEAGLDAWIDSKPIPLRDLISLEMDQGKHTVILGIDRKQVTDPFAIEVSGDGSVQ